MNIFLDLFLTFFKIGAFSFGGGYAMIPLMQEEIIEVHNWISSAEFIDIIAISEMTPGPIAVNSATYLGYKVAGIAGSAFATFGVVLPSFIVMTLIFYFVSRFKNSIYVEWAFRGIRLVVLGLITSAAVSVGQTAFIDIKSVGIAALIFYLVGFKKFNAIYAIILAGVLGIILY